MMSDFAPLSMLTVGIPGAGRRTLLSVLPENRELPERFRLCVLDAERMDNPEQITLLDQLAADASLRVLFALNKADRCRDLRAVLRRTLALLRERGFYQAEIYPVCAKAAKLFCLPAEDESLTPEELTLLGELYDRYAPGENSLSAFAVTEIPSRRLGSRSLTPEQQSLALINTGVPALKAALLTRDWNVRKAAPSQVIEDSADQGESGELRTEDEAITALLEMASKMDCAGVLELARTVQNGDAPQDFRDKAMDVLQKAYLDRSREELEAMTEGVEEMDIPALQALTEKINVDLYPVQIRTPYADRVTQRIDALQREALDAICAGVEEADSRELARIWEELENADCAEVLKTEYFSRIEARQETLDVEALERVTAGAETMSENDLKAVAVTLEADNWNPKFVTAYRHKIDLCRDAAVFRELSAEMAELNDMERQEVLELRERIREKELPPRFSAGAQNRIGERLYRMDMLRLMALGNDFDALDFEGIDALRAQVVRGDFMERAREEYLDRLLTRENALIVERTDARAQLVRQLIGQY